MKKNRMATVILLLAAVVLWACSEQKPAVGSTADPLNSPTPVGGLNPLEALPNEGALERGKVNLEFAQILVKNSFPVEVKLMLIGELPGQCHYLRVEVSEPDDEGNIIIGVFSLFDPDEKCSKKNLPFEQYLDLDLTGFSGGIYLVEINGTASGGFEYPGQKTPIPAIETPGGGG